MKCKAIESKVELEWLICLSKKLGINLKNELNPSEIEKLEKVIK